MLEETLRLSCYESSLPQKYALIRNYKEYCIMKDMEKPKDVIQTRELMCYLGNRILLPRVYITQDI